MHVQVSQIPTFTSPFVGEESGDSGVSEGHFVTVWTSVGA